MRAVGHAVAVFCFIATGFIAGVSKAEEPAMDEAKLKAVQIARAYVATRFPDFDLAGRAPLIRSAIAADYRADFSGRPVAEFAWPPSVGSTHETWTVEYPLPEGWLGGGPVVIIDKRKLTVLHAYSTQ
ncbi:hypothetical protein JQ604_11000 [Bradyrhizobium jicamae]|uniref:hypothetical protein n=1 Tax=Bradyrhizobium jicamae TaxID=280332 RepID=UPI001BAD4304|nr:hypothetical protein [Bradyrhizobium jicamae]MBR0752712.1 hypothetical protein [Bradyrhizobium jicamae]